MLKRQWDCEATGPLTTDHRRLADPGLDYTIPSGLGKASVDYWSGLPCEAALLGMEIGTRQSTLPVGASPLGTTPHIAHSGAFLALSAPDRNRWPRRWASGQRRDWDVVGAYRSFKRSKMVTISWGRQGKLTRPRDTGSASPASSSRFARCTLRTSRGNRMVTRCD